MIRLGRIIIILVKPCKWRNAQTNDTLQNHSAWGMSQMIHSYHHMKFSLSKKTFLFLLIFITSGEHLGLGWLQNSMRCKCTTIDLKRITNVHISYFFPHKFLFCMFWWLFFSLFQKQLLMSSLHSQTSCFHCVLIAQKNILQSIVIIICHLV